MEQDLAPLLEEVLTRYEKGESAASLAALYGPRLQNVAEEDFVAAEGVLLAQGRSNESLQELCDVHGAIYLWAKKKEEEAPSALFTPFSLFEEENRVLSSRVTALRKEATKKEWTAFQEGLPFLSPLSDHYEEKENLFFPYLLRHSFRAPVQVMWAKDDEIRTLLKTALNDKDLSSKESFVAGFLDEVEAMVDKENKILLPLLQKNLSEEEKTALAEEMVELPHSLLQRKVSRNELGLKEKEMTIEATPEGVPLPTGALSLQQLQAILNAIPEELTFIDKDNHFVYFNEPKEKAFLRSKASLGERVEDCHPAKVLPVVMGVLKQLSSGEKERIDFSLVKKGRKIENHYLALHDDQGDYLGCLEVTEILSEAK